MIIKDCSFSMAQPEFGALCTALKEMAVAIQVVAKQMTPNDRTTAINIQGVNEVERAWPYQSWDSWGHRAQGGASDYCNEGQDDD